MNVDEHMNNRLLGDLERLGPEAFFRCLKHFVQQYAGRDHSPGTVDALMGLAVHLDDVEREFKTW